jgi:hypothetical protein
VSLSIHTTFCQSVYSYICLSLCLFIQLLYHSHLFVCPPIEEGKAQYSWSLCTNYFRWGAFDIANCIFCFTKQATLIKKSPVLSLSLKLVFSGSPVHSYLLKSVCFSVYPSYSLRLSICPSICSSVSLSIHKFVLIILPVHLSICLFVCPPVIFSLVCTSVINISIHPSISLSIFPPPLLCPSVYQFFVFTI